MAKKTLTIILPIFVFLASFGVYLVTLSPTISAGDSTEMVTAALTLGVPHQPSYPLNTILGHLFSRLHLGQSPVWRVNLMSAVFEALTCVLIYFIIVKLYRVLASHLRGGLASHLPLNASYYFLAFSASLFLAFSLNFWQYGTKAEVFALNNFLVSLVILSTLIALEKKTRKWFYLTAFLASLAFTHHPTAILLTPALFFLVLGQRKELLRERDFLFKAVIFALLGFLIYYFSLTTLAKKDPLLNWGNPVNLSEVLRALRRADYGTFSAYLQGLEEVNYLVPLDQIKFYLKSLASDFTLIGLFLAAIGILYSFKISKKVFWFLLLGLGTGVFFLAYANFPLGDSFHQATTKRFQLLPNLFLTGFIGIGIMAIWQKFLKLNLDFKEVINRFTQAIVFLSLSFVFLIPLMANFSKANNSKNQVTVKYARDFYLPTEENAIILLSGDVSNFAAYYIKAVELGKDNRIVFTPGQFHLKWFIPQLKSRYPDLVIPSPLPGKRFTTTTQVIEANVDRRPIYISPELVFYDPEVEEKFVLWPKNLLFKVRNKGGEEKLEDYREESQKIWQSLPLSSFSWLKKNKPLMDEVIISYYVRYFHNLGYMFESVKLYDDAVREYKRGVEIDPTFAESIKSLGVVLGFKMDPPDYGTAINYFSRYLSLLKLEDLEKAQAAQGAIQELNYKAYQEAAKEASAAAQQQASQASVSGQLKEATAAGE